MLHLASQSPRRRQLLEQLGVDFAVLNVAVPEQRVLTETPQAYVSRVARDKARAGLALLAEVDGRLVLGADTEVVLDDEVFGKPHDAAEATAMLRRLSARTHTVISAVWLVGARHERSATCISQVTFADIERGRGCRVCRHGRVVGQGRGVCHPGSRRGADRAPAGQLLRGDGPAAV